MYEVVHLSCFKLSPFYSSLGIIFLIDLIDVPFGFLTNSSFSHFPQINNLKKIKALLIAEAANPEWPSVPLVGWSHSQAIAKEVDAHLVTQIRNRQAINAAGLVEGIDFTAIDSEAVASPIHRLTKLLTGGSGKGWTTGMALSLLSYYYFESRVWKIFGKRIKDKEFDLVHRVTPLSPTIPSLLAGKCRKMNVPFILGPLNGGVPWPRQFDSARRREREWLSYVRNFYKLVPGYRSTRKNSAAILIASRATWDQMPDKYRSKCIYIPENGIDPVRFVAETKQATSLPLKVMFLGRLVPYKGADMLLESITELVKQSLVTLDIVGDGPEAEKLKSFAEAENLKGGIRFHGWIEHTKVQGHLAKADILAVPSIREFGGGVALEAMALGVVPAVVDYGGLGELVTQKTGFLIPLGSRKDIIDHYRSLFFRLAKEPILVDRLRQNALNRAKLQFTWEEKARQVLEVYKWVLSENGQKPWFGMPIPDLD